MALTRRPLAVALLAATAALAASARARAGGDATGPAPAAPAAAPSDGPPAPEPVAWRDGRLVVPKGLPSPWVPPSNPATDAKIALGRRLFVDRRLSRDGTKSCADCHEPRLGLGDGRRTAVGVREQVGPRNVPTLWNVATYPALFWDGRAVSLEAQAEGPLLAPTELDMTEALLVERVAADAGYGPAFVAAFGSATVTLRRVAHALASFERTLLAGDAPFDRWWFHGEEAAVTPAACRWAAT